MWARARLICERLGVTVKRKGKRDLFWKRQIEGDIVKIRKDLSQIDDWFKGKWKYWSKKRKDDPKEKYWIKTRGFKVVIKETKQCILAKTEKLRWFENHIKQFKWNRVFQNNQKAKEHYMMRKMEKKNHNKIHLMQVRKINFGSCGISWLIAILRLNT